MKKIDYHSPFEYENYYHIYNRGNSKQNIFFNHQNYIYFLTNWKKYLSELLDVYSFCLLPNHLHFLGKVRAEREINTGKNQIYDINSFLEERFRRLFITYSQAINKEQDRTESLFQKRFKRIKINSNEYFWWVVHYIHNNPVHQ